MTLGDYELCKIFNKEKVKRSTYTTRQNRTYIRLINTRPEHASYPALYPNLKEYRDELIKYSNVPGKRLDTNIVNQHLSAEITILPKERPPLPNNTKHITTTHNNTTKTKDSNE